MDDLGLRLNPLVGLPVVVTTAPEVLDLVLIGRMDFVALGDLVLRAYCTLLSKRTRCGSGNGTGWLLKTVLILNI